MSLEWFLFLSAIPTIIIPCVQAGLHDLPISDTSSVGEKTMKSILESCYDDESLSETVLVVGHFNEFIDKLPMIRINNFENHRPDSLSNFKPTRIIIVIHSLDKFVMNLNSLKKMSLWNYMASFFFILKTTQWNEDILVISLIVKKMNIINSIYIRAESINSSVLYTTNIYSDYAPYPWKLVKKYYGASFYSQRFDRNVSCRSLNYDKTTNLNEYEMKAIALKSPGPYSELMENDDITTNDNLSFRMVGALMKALNSNDFSYSQQPKSSALESLYAGSVDLVFIPSSIEEDPDAKFLYPYSQDRIVAVIKSSPKKSIQRKILRLWNFSVIFLAFIALAILFLILSWKYHEFSSASLNIIRLIIHSSVLTDIRSNSFRIFLTTILMMMIISNRSFQGEMASFLTSPEKNAAIERIETLVQLGYKLYSTPGLKQSIQSLCPECRAMTVELDECFKYVLEDRLTACLIEESIYQHVAFMPFDVVKEPLVQPFLVTKCRDDWPLYDRVNDMWMRIFESGLPNFWKTQQTFRSLRKRQVQNIERSSTQYQPIKLHELLFAFKFLAIGLLLSTLVFIAELLVKNYRCMQWLNQQCAG